MMPPRLLCVGDLNADITITPSTPIAAGSDTPGTVRLTGGGSAANVAATAAAAADPVAVRFVGVVGDDLLGDVLVDGLARAGIETRAVRRTSTASRAIAALVGADGERSMVSDLATATAMRVADIDPEWFVDVDWLHLTGYSLFAPDGPAVVSRLIAEAVARSIAWSFDPSSAEMLEVASIELRGVSIVFPNRDEAEEMTGFADPIEAATALLDTSDTAVVTCGGDGAHVARRGRESFHVPAESITIVNTLGCGDAFAGAFLASRMRGGDDVVAARLATRAASIVAGRAASR